MLRCKIATPSTRGRAGIGGGPILSLSNEASPTVKLCRVSLLRMFGLKTLFLHSTHFVSTCLLAMGVLNRHPFLFVTLLSETFLLQTSRRFDRRKTGHPYRMVYPTRSLQHQRPVTSPTLHSSTSHWLAGRCEHLLATRRSSTSVQLVCSTSQSTACRCRTDALLFYDNDDRSGVHTRLFLAALWSPRTPLADRADDDRIGSHSRIMLESTHNPNKHTP